ncbi:MAG: fatty acid desaturase [Chitinophagales bacterium]|nr:fatty acid desaturase [Chitinophagales bacterium]
MNTSNEQKKHMDHSIDKVNKKALNDLFLPSIEETLEDRVLRELSNWHTMLKKYQKPNTKIAIRQTLLSLSLFISVWSLQYYLLHFSFWWVALVGVLNGLFLGRIFIIQHDCGHKSYTQHQWLNDIIGTLCSITTIIPYKYWAKNHDYHHAHNGQLETSGIGDVECLSVSEYKNLSLMKKIRYRIYRSPFYLFTIGGFIYVAIYNRFAFLRSGYFEKVKNNVTWNNLFFTAVYIGLCLLLEWDKFLIVQGVNLFFFGTYALWFFYIQHQYEDVYKRSKENWNYVLSAIRGSTFYDIPRVFHWLTGNIGYHHIHHLCPSIPNYFLPLAAKENPAFQRYAVKLTFLESLKTIYANLWDEENNKMISFGTYRKLKKSGKI